MIKFTGFTLFVGAAIAAASSLGGCSSSSSPASTLSAEGESCARTADCSSNLACIASTCLPKGSSVSDAGVVIGVDGNVGTPLPGVPDSSTGTVPEAAPARLSALGEGCQSAANCASGLICIPSSPYGGLGICDVGSYGLTPTGKTCTGECNTGADCCELPLNVSIVGFAGAIHTCQDILTSVLVGNTTQCSQALTPASAIGEGCFYYATYCSTCAASNIWSCTSNQCVYNHSCQNSGNTLNGCPTLSRAGRGLVSNCDAMSNTCKAAPTVGACTADADCDGKTTADSALTCRGGDCTCYQQACYIKCAADLDCRQGYHCNAGGTKLCEQNKGCSTDADCAVATGAANAKCSMGTCKTTCKSDHDCSSSGVVHSQYLDNFNGEVCGSDGFCSVLGCSGDPDCQNTGSNPGGNTVHLFCVNKAATPTAVVVQSAITN